MKSLRGIVFDCDGVLLESRKANLAYYNAILAEYDAPAVSFEDVQTATLCHTASSPQVLETLLGQERVAEALRYAESLDYRQFIPFLSLEPGLPDALGDLSAEYSLALATNRGTSAPELLEHFGLRKYFSAIVTSRDVTRPKPWPDMLHEAGRRLKCASHEMIFVGDSGVDHQAARGAGVRFVAYKNGFDGDLRVDSHQELVALIQGQL